MTAPMTAARLAEIRAQHRQYLDQRAAVRNAVVNSAADHEIDDLEAGADILAEGLGRHAVGDLLDEVDRARAEIRRMREAEAAARAAAFEGVAQMFIREGMTAAAVLVFAYAEFDAEDRAQLAAKEA